MCLRSLSLFKMLHRSNQSILISYAYDFERITYSTNDLCKSVNKNQMKRERLRVYIIFASELDYSFLFLLSTKNKSRSKERTKKREWERKRKKKRKVKRRLNKQIHINDENGYWTRLYITKSSALQCVQSICCYSSSIHWTIMCNLRNNFLLSLSLSLSALTNYLESQYTYKVMQQWNHPIIIQNSSNNVMLTSSSSSSS